MTAQDETDQAKRNQARQDQGWLELMLELDGDGQPAPDQLVRYAQDPAALPESERRALEAQLGASPALADQVRVLRSADWSRLRDPEPNTVPTAAARSRPRWLSWLWAPGLALASVVAVVVYPLLQEPPPDGRLAEAPPGESTPAAPADAPGKDAPDPDASRLAQAPPPTTEAPRPETPSPPRLAETGPDTRPGPAPGREPQPDAVQPEPETRLAGAGPEGDAGTGPAPAPRAPAPEPPTRLAQAELPEPEPRPDPAPVRSARPTPRPEAQQPPTTEPPAPEPDAPPQALMLAMAEPVYAAPDFGGDTGTTIIRGEQTRPSALAVGPDHLALAGTPRPKLYWHLGTPLPRGAQPLLSLEREDNGDLLVEIELPRPAATGWQVLDLGQLGIQIPGGTPLYWSVSLFDPANPGAALATGARIQLRARPAELIQRLGSAGPGQAPALLAGAGYWYDALAAAVQLRQANPDNTSVAEGLRSLLDQGGFEDLPLP